VAGNDKYIDPAKLKSYKDNFITNVNKILCILDNNHINATFFVLGKIAEEMPDIIAQINNSGHEIACHSYDHKPIYKHTKSSFGNDLLKCKDAIGNAIGAAPIGFRAPNFSINKKTLWAIDILSELDFLYDSSIYPISIHPEYGLAKSDLEPYKYTNGVIEFPMSVYDKFIIRIPCSGGAYLRFYPYSAFSAMFGYSSRTHNPAIFYIHPWELGHSAPPQSMDIVMKFRQKYNISNTYNKLNILTHEYDFTSFKDYIISNNLFYNEH
jgi:polysaccharide deacetylase family protein (PEP-CTERM system associated)